MNTFQVVHTDTFQPNKTVFGDWRELYQVLDAHFSPQHQIHPLTEEALTDHQKQQWEKVDAMESKDFVDLRSPQ